MKWFQFVKTTSDGTTEVDITSGNITVSGSFNSSGLAQDSTLRSGDALTKITSDNTHTAAVINSQPTGSEYGLVVRPIGGTAGTPGGEIITVQGDPNGTPVPVTGSFFVSIPAVGTNGNTAPASSMEAGAIDQFGNLQGLRASNTTPSQSDIGLLVRPIGATTISGNVSIGPGPLGTNTIKQLNNQVVSSDYGIVTNTVIHGLTTGGGGGYVDVKVNPSGALLADVSGSSVSVSNLPSVQHVIVDNQTTSSGVVSVSNFPTVQTISGVVTVLNQPVTTTSGVVTTKISNTSRWNGISIPASITNTILLNENINRAGCTIVNNTSSGIMYIKFGPVASLTDYTYFLLPGFNAPGGILEFPQPIYNGVVSAIWSTAAGTAMVTEAVY